MIEADFVHRVLDALESASVRVCLDGGWGVDALLGEQTRPHADLDLVVGVDDADALTRALGGIGLHPRSGVGSANVVLRDDRGREVDVHLVRFDARGDGRFPLPDGRVWPFHAAAFSGRGRIAGREVRCLSVDAQVQCHAQGYAPTENDLRDMERLQLRFGVVLPIALCRQPGARQRADDSRRADPGELTPFGLHGMQPVLGVPDVHETVAFYRDALGFHVDFVEGDPPVHARVCADPTHAGPTVHVRFEPLDPGAAVGPAVDLWLHVGSGLDRLCDRYRERGVEILEPPSDRPWGLRQFTIRDCNGYVASFCAEISSQR